MIVALDFASAADALSLVHRLDGLPVGMFKIGSELFTSAGPSLVRQVIDAGHRVFLDLKFHDIPNTVAGAVRAAGRLGVALLNVHTSGGMTMMKAALAAARETPGMRLIGVTVLTSLGAGDLSQAGIAAAPREQVLRLAEMAAEAGLDGVVASPEEAAQLRARFPRPFLIVTPGIRPAPKDVPAVGETPADPTLTGTRQGGGRDALAPALLRGNGSAAADQKRIATPAAAISAGVDYIVVGRPITAAPDPRAAAKQIIDELAH